MFERHCDKSCGKICILSLAMILCSACGQAKYEERLQATAEFYEYMGAVEANLSSPIWERADLGMKMRLPIPFRVPMPGPELLTDAEGNQYFGPDPRQPDVLGGDLPGIVEAWQATLPGESGEPVDSRIYVLTNHSRFRLVDGAIIEEPMEFLADLEAQLSAVFGVFVADEEANQVADNMRFALTVPAPRSVSAKYITPKQYTAIRFVSEEPVNGQQIQAMLYSQQAGDIQAAVLILGPRSFSSQFRQRIDLALQTFSVTPRLSSEMNRTTGAPITGGTSGF